MCSCQRWWRSHRAPPTIVLMKVDLPLAPARSANTKTCSEVSPVLQYPMYLLEEILQLGLAAGHPVEEC